MFQSTGDWLLEDTALWLPWDVLGNATKIAGAVPRCAATNVHSKRLPDVPLRSKATGAAGNVPVFNFT